MINIPPFPFQRPLLPHIRNKKLLLTLFLLVVLPVIVTVAMRTTDIRQRASTTLKTEAEAAVLSGDTTLVSDDTASGGKAILFGDTNPTSPPPTPSSTTFQPTAPYYATFFYPWSGNPATDGSWSYWQDNGHAPPSNWFSNYLPDPDPISFDPATELYSSNNDQIIYWQLRKLAEARQEVAISSWWGQNHKTDKTFRKIITDVMNRPDNPYPHLRWSLYYEQEGFNDYPVSQMVDDLNYIKSNYTSQPAYFKINGRPVIFVYGDAADGSGMASRWKQVRDQTGFYVVLKLFPGYQTDPNQPDSWHQYAPATRSQIHSPHSAMVSPGFWLVDTAERLPRNASEFETAVTSMVQANATWKLTETWNEWGEGTSVEPGEQVTQTKSGQATLKTNGYLFKNLYVDILKRNLPPLEAGTGAGQAPLATPTLAVQPTLLSDDPVIAAAGDIVCGSSSSGAACKQLETSNLLLTINPDVVLPLGDIQYENGALSDFNTFYHPTWGRLKSKTRPVVGNHEYLTTNASGYFDYFNGVGVQTGSAGDRAKGYYAYTLGSWRLYALNSNCSQAGGCQAGSPQETWLKNDLAANPKKCVLAYYHHPLHTSGSRASESKVQDLYKALYTAGADVILAGHEHNYERFAPQDVSAKADPRGIREFVVGTGGRNFTKFVSIAPNSEARNDNTFGVLKMTLHATSYTWEFLPIAGSLFTDKGSSNCS